MLPRFQMENRVGPHDEGNCDLGTVAMILESPHGGDRVKNSGARAIHTRLRQRGHEPRMLGARQRDHRKAMLECAELRRGLMRRPAGWNEENAVQTKPALGGACYGDVAGVYGIESAAKKRDASSSGGVGVAPGGRLRFQISSPFHTSRAPQPPSPLHQAIAA